MQIQWYPGHMYKANKQIKEVLPQVDVVIEILDARIPFSSENPLLQTLRKDKPCIKVLAKSDLADPDKTALWQHWLEQEKGVKTLALSIHQPENFQQLPKLCRKIAGQKIQQDKPIHAMIMGIPNVGKSTLINIIAGRTIAKTGNEPAITKAQQRIFLDSGIQLSDTPGVLWPNLENKNSGYRLATTGAIKDTAMEYTDVALFAAEFLLEAYPQRLEQRYQISPLPKTDLEFLEAIGKKRGCLRSGGNIDLDKAARILLMELRDGTLGRITLESPEVMQAELIELEIIREKKAEKKRRRRQRK